MAFEGRIDPTTTERWIDLMETIFSVLECTSEQRVQLAAFKLEDKAKSWWASMKPNTEATGVRWNWDQFKERFLAYYFPTSLRACKEVEFLTLKQGNLSEEDYINKFLDLAKYSPYLQTTRDDRWKAQRLVEGARPDLKEMLAAMEITSFEELCAKMHIVAQRIKEPLEEHKSAASSASAPS